jgi:hypothetical protein
MIGGISSLQLVHIATLLLTILSVTNGDQDFFHQTPDQYKLSPGWQEPGFWRPKFIMDRVFTSPDGTPEYEDRIYFKLKPDRTMKIYRSSSRPKFELFKKAAEGEKKKKKLFESGDEEVESFEEQYRKQKQEQDDSFFEVDGTWWWQDAAPLNQGRVKLETREEDADGEPEKILFQTRCDWGTMDSYAPKFREGKISKYKLEAGLPIGSVPAGTFTIRVTPHRPLVSKDFMAFQ